MNTPYTDQEHVLNVDGERLKVLIRTPATLARRPALLVNLAGDRATSLDVSPYSVIPNILLAAGHRVASFDMPFHGERTNKYGSDLPGMAAAMAAGVDVFAGLGSAAQAVVDFALQNELSPEKTFLVAGTSRGGLAILHMMAGEPRIFAGVAHVPLTYIPEPREFSHLADNPVVARSNAIALIPKLADRNLFISMGTTDPRVGAHRCFHFHEMLCEASVSNPPVLFVGPGESHGNTFNEEAAYHAGAAFLLERTAIKHNHELTPPST